jgi:hypothetical protein
MGSRPAPFSRRQSLCAFSPRMAMCGDVRVQKRPAHPSGAAALTGKPLRGAGHSCCIPGPHCDVLTSPEWHHLQALELWNPFYMTSPPPAWLLPLSASPPSVVRSSRSLPLRPSKPPPLPNMRLPYCFLLLPLLAAAAVRLRGIRIDGDQLAITLLVVKMLAGMQNPPRSTLMPLCARAIFNSQVTKIRPLGFVTLCGRVQW